MTAKEENGLWLVEPCACAGQTTEIAKQEYGNKDITAMLQAIKQVMEVSEFRESAKQQRIWARNFLYLMKGTEDRAPIPPEEIKRRLLAIKDDKFKGRNRNNLNYLYKEVKSYVEPNASSFEL